MRLENTQRQHSRLFPNKPSFLSSAPDKSSDCDEMQLLLIFNVRAVWIHFSKRQTTCDWGAEKVFDDLGPFRFAAAKSEADAAPRAAWASAFGFCLNCSFWNKVPITPTSPSYHPAPVNLHVDKSPDLSFSSPLLINEVRRHVLKSLGLQQDPSQSQN